MFKIGQKVAHKEEGFQGVVVSNQWLYGTMNWFGVMWTLPNGRREQRVEHCSAIK